MAYGNWGAFVYKNGERQKNREDNTPFREDELQNGYQQAFGRSDTKYDPHHASLGSGPFRLCGYKSSPVILWEGKVVEGIVDWEKFTEEGISGELNGYKYRAIYHEDPESVDLWCQDPDGTQWTSLCGYCLGAGHQD